MSLWTHLNIYYSASVTGYKILNTGYDTLGPSHGILEGGSYDILGIIYDI